MNAPLTDTFVIKLSNHTFVVFKEDYNPQKYIYEISNKFVGVVSFRDGKVQFWENAPKHLFENLRPHSHHSLFNLNFSDFCLINWLEKLGFLEKLFSAPSNEEFADLVKKSKAMIEPFGLGINYITYTRDGSSESIQVDGYSCDNKCKYQEYGSISREKYQNCRRLTSMYKYNYGSYAALAETAVKLYLKMPI
jgi:hypothetical protein